MTTPNIEPRADTEGSIGSASYRWGDVFTSGDLSDGTNAVSPLELKTAYDHSVLTSGNPHVVTYTEVGADQAGTAAAAVASHEGLYDHTEIGNAATIQGTAVAITAPSNGEALVFNSTTSEYEPTTISTLSAVTTDATLTGDGTAGDALGLPTLAVTPGSYVLASITVDAQGRLTAASSGTAINDSTISGDGTAASPLSVVNDGHTHTTGTITGLGTAAAKNVPTIGVDATTAQVVMGDDSRLTDDRDPNAHAITHESGGVDAVNHDSLAGFVADEHVAHSGVTLTAGTGLTGGGTIAASRTFALADTAVTPGSYVLMSGTVDQQGRLTAAASGTVATSALLTGAGTTASPITIADTAVTPGSYTYAGFTVDQQGRLTAAASGATPMAAATYDPNTVARDVFEGNFDFELHGFEDRTETSAPTFNDSTYVVTLTDAGSGWSYWRNGRKYDITGNKTVTLAGSPPTADQYFIYIDDTSGTLTASTTAWTLEDGKVPVAIVIWDNALTPKYIVQDERHTVVKNKVQHAYEHLTIGTRYQQGGALSSYAVAPSSPADADNQFAIAETIIWDEDIKHTLAALAAAGDYHIEYRTGASTWAWLQQAIPFRYTTSGYIQWDNAGTMTEGANNRFYNTYILATTATGTARYSVIHGQSEFSTLAAAQLENFQNLDKSGLQFVELVAIWRITWETKNTYSTTGLCRVAAAPTSINLGLISAPSGGGGAGGTNACEIGIACSDETTDLTTGLAKVTFRMPYAMSLTAVRANVNTAPTGATIIVDINEATTSILSTKLSIDATEFTSTTAATPAVISDGSLADDAEITIDIDQVGSTIAGKGLKVWLIGTRA